MSTKKHADPNPDRDALRDQVIGLGEQSLRKSHFPQLMQQIEELSAAKAALEERSAALLRILQDLDTARAHAEESERRFRTLVEHLPQRIFLKSRQSVYVLCNPAYARDLGISPQNIEGRTDHDFHPPDLAEQYRAEDRQVLATAQPLTVERRYLRQGRERWVQVTKVPYSDEQGRIVGVLGIFEDVTERKAMEEHLREVQKMESIGRLAGGVAHDFNNMLQAIVGHADMVLEQLPGSDRHRQDLEAIRGAAMRSADLTRQLLAFARRQAVSPVVVDLNRAISSMESMLRRLVGESIELSWRPGQDLWAIRIDPSQVDEIIVNLVVNARDAIYGTGSITIETANVVCDGETDSTATPGEYAVLIVRDTGEGMEPETLDHIFEPFYTTKGIGRGTGLGLPMVYGAVQQNNGAIEVHSRRGEGTLFRLYFPRVQAEAPQQRDAPASERSTDNHETILLVEDEPAILNLNKSVLSLEGYTVLAAPTPQQAIAMAGEHSGTLHLLLTDVVMPGMNGRELRDLLVAGRPEMKCVFVSGYPANIIAQQGKLPDGVHFLQKPFRPAALLDVVRAALNGQAPARSD